MHSKMDTVYVCNKWARNVWPSCSLWLQELWAGWHDNKWTESWKDIFKLKCWNELIKLIATKLYIGYYLLTE